MTIGFTGTSHDMTRYQVAVLGDLLDRLKVTTLHHGCCVGSDYRAHRMARHRRIAIVGHPPTNAVMTMPIVESEFTLLCVPKPFLARDNDIAYDGVDGLLATPQQAVEILRSGTWATVRRARRFGRRIWIVRPDGTVVEEPAAGA